MNLVNLRSEVIKGLPSFLMGAGGAFSLTATLDGVRSTFNVIEDGYDRGYFLSKEVPAKDKLRVISKYYWHTGVKMGLATGCFVGAMCGYNSQIAGATAIASYFEKELHDYRRKAADLYGEEADKHIREEVVKERVEQNPPPSRNSQDAYLIYDPVTDQYFEATQKEIDHAEHELNRIFCKECAVRYNYVLRFFRKANSKKAIGDDIGWFLDESYYEYHYYNESFFAHPLVEIVLDPQPGPDGSDIYVLYFTEEPMLNLELDADVVKDSQDKQGL